MYFNNSQNNNISSVNSEYEETIGSDDDQMTFEDYLEAFDFYEHFEERMEELKKSDEEVEELLERSRKSNERTKKVLAIARSVVSSGYENIDEALEQIKEIQQNYK